MIKKLENKISLNTQIKKQQKEKSIYINPFNEKIKKLNRKTLKKIKKCLNKIKIIIISLFIIIIIMPEIKNFDHNYKNIILKNIINEEIYTSKKNSLKSGRKFINSCLKGININIKRFEAFKEIKITVIIPIYNTGEIIKSVLKSVQNQNFIDLEIIIVNDFSKDNTLEIIEKIKKEDSRIKIINNVKNMGILYSRSIAVLQSKGEYIINLDHDDLFFDEDVLDTSYKEAKMENYDIISFMYLECKKYFLPINKMREGHCNKHIHNLTVFQPELSIYPLFKNEKYSTHDSIIWGKLFKNDIYKKAVNILGKERYSIYNIYNEDQIGVFTIFSIAGSYKYIRKYGIYHLVEHDSASNNADSAHRIYVEIFLADIIYDISKNENKKYSAIYTEKKFRLIKNLNQNNLEYLRKVLNKIMFSQYIEEKYKMEIRKIFFRFKENK